MHVSKNIATIEKEERQRRPGICLHAGKISDRLFSEIITATINREVYGVETEEDKENGL